MGFRTTVILFNDHAHEWSKDPLLGEKIMRAASYVNSGDSFGDRSPDIDNVGRVVECTHADTQTIGVLDSYDFTPLGHSHWRQHDADRDLRLLKEAADRLGYQIRKKSERNVR